VSITFEKVMGFLTNKIREEGKIFCRWGAEKRTCSWKLIKDYEGIFKIRPVRLI